MALTQARTDGILIAMQDGGPVILPPGVTVEGGQVDLLGSNSSVGEITVYLVTEAAVDGGNVVTTFHPQRVSGASYRSQSSLPPTPVRAGLQKQRVASGPCPRYASAGIKNDGGSLDLQALLLYDITIWESEQIFIPPPAGEGDEEPPVS